MVKAWHLDRGFRDVGYHYMIDGQGELHKGRKDSEVGAHCRGKNKDSIGICVFGNFEKQDPTTCQLNTLYNLLASLTNRYYGVQVKYHRDFANTICPGKNLYGKK